MIYAHFAKLIAETMFLNRLAGRMMPLNRAMWQFLYYWVGLGGFVGYSVFHPDFTPSRFVPDADGEGGYKWFCPLLAILFIFFEIYNLQCHMHFSTMERNMAAAVIQNSNDRSFESRSRRSYLVASISKLVVLRDHGFSLVTCADWLWEFLSWICFTLVTQTFYSYIFLLTWFVWHNSKA
jgi:very-long-chain enoyl-CoA reductase